MAFHPRFGTFATGGGDGSIYFWDGESKSRLKSLRGYPTSIAALALSASGTRLAVAASYAFEKVGRARFLSRVIAWACVVMGRTAVQHSYFSMSPCTHRPTPLRHHPQGDIEHPADGIYVRSVADEEVWPKSMKAAAA